MICESFFIGGAFLTCISTLQIHVTSSSWERSGTIFCKALTNPPVSDLYNLCGRDGYWALCSMLAYKIPNNVTFVFDMFRTTSSV